MSQTKQVILNDGRRLAYDEFGDPQGPVVFWFHGAPGSRLLRPPAVEVGARIITVDRPGFGLSDPKPGRCLLDWPDDVAALADALGVERFAVVGVSGGGPQAAACAYKLPERVVRLGLVSSPAPFDVPGLAGTLPAMQRFQFALAARAPWLVGLLFGFYGRAARKATPKQVLAKLTAELPLLEVALIRRPGMVEIFIADTLEAMRQGGGAVAQDLGLLAQPWGFRPEEIQVPTYVWQGDLDTNVSLAMGQYLGRTIPGCQVTICPGEGHLVGLTHWEEIMRTVMG